jgi:predicted DCC family thiol-disulfide oxidoreductase YuxK
MKILFFDGYCSLCSGLVDWAMRHDKHARIQFASLQGETATAVMSGNNMSATDTVVYCRDGKTYQQSSAVLYLLSDMGGVWVVSRVFFLVPRIFRDLVYKWVAANRYRIFKRRETCRLPTLQEKDRLLP